MQNITNTGFYILDPRIQIYFFNIKIWLVILDHHIKLFETTTKITNGTLIKIIMKKLITTILGLSLILIVNAQDKDSMTYTQFRYDFMNVNVVHIEKINITHESMFKPAMILLGTFAINHLIININEKNNNHEYTSILTGTVFLIGITTTTIVTFSENKKRNCRIL